METYIVRIHRHQEEDRNQASAGIVENADTGRKSKFTCPEELLKILKVKETGGKKKTKKKKKYKPAVVSDRQ